jgi:hypothetical protein
VSIGSYDESSSYLISSWANVLVRWILSQLLGVIACGAEVSRISAQNILFGTQPLPLSVIFKNRNSHEKDFANRQPSFAPELPCFFDQKVEQESSS